MGHNALYTVVHGLGQPASHPAVSLEEETVTRLAFLPADTMGRGAWRATSWGVAESAMTQRLNDIRSRALDSSPSS